MTDYVQIRFDDRAPYFTPSLQRSGTGNFINFSIQADGNFGISLNGSLSAIPQLAQVAAIIQGILGIFGLGQAPAEPPSQPKTITIDPGVTLATLFGASQGVAFLVQILKGKINQVKNYINSAVTSIQNLVKCLLKNPLLAAALLAKLIRQGWITMPEPLKKALEAARDLINKTIGLNLIIYNPFAEYLKKLKEWLQYKFPPPILLPFIPYIPGCSPGFYSGTPPLYFNDITPIVAEVDPQIVTSPNGFTSKIDLKVPTIPVDFGPGAKPDLALTDEQVKALLGSYNPYDPYLSGIAPNILDSNLISSFPLGTGSNSVTRQVQDKLISASNSVVSSITALSKDISRSTYIPRPSPLDDLLCAPGEKY
jgi:hypothetical protein